MSGVHAACFEDGLKARETILRLERLLAAKDTEIERLRTDKEIIYSNLTPEQQRFIGQKVYEARRALKEEP